MHGSRRRFVAALALAASVAVVLVVVTSFASSGDGAPEPSSGALRQVPCQNESRTTVRSTAPLTVVCHTFEVPMDRDDPDRARLQLAVVVVGTTSAERLHSDPVVVVHGGPGASLTDRVADWLDPPSPLLAHRDVVLVDQRGSGRSQPRLDCEPSEDLARCHDRLAESGIDLDEFGSRAQALDLVDLRRALGYERWNVYAVSFGTRVALHLLALDAGGVRVAVLDSVYPPDARPGAEQAPNASQAVLDAAGVPGRSTELQELLDELARDPMEVVWVDEAGTSHTETLDADLFAQRLFTVLYEPGRARDVADAVRHAIDGDLVRALRTLGASTATPTAAAGNQDLDIDDLADGAYWAAECSEGLGRTTPEAAVAAAEGALAEVLVRRVVAAIETCSSWTVDTVAPWTPTPTSIPTLLVGSSVDPVTPIRWARATALALGPSASVVEVPDGGHVPSFSLDCVEQLVDAFVRSPTDPPSGLRCG